MADPEPPAPAEAASAGPRPLRALAVRYTALRLGIFAVCFALGVAIFVPTAGAQRTSFLDAGLLAIVASIPAALVLGRNLRGEITDAIDAQRAVARAKADDDAARVEAARARRQAPRG
jgi:hypothetical protein